MENSTRIIKSFFIQLIHQYDLDINVIKDKNGKDVFKIKDLQGNNFGKIENEEFHNLSDIISNLDIYHDEYIFDSLDKRQEKKEIINNDDWDLIASRFLKSEKVQNVLEQTYPYNFNDIIKDNVSKELRKLLDKEEFPLIFCYIEKAEELFDIVPYDTLIEYEKSLYLYFETSDIIREEDEIYSKSNNTFNKNIIKLSESVIEYDTFIENEQLKECENVETEEI